LPSGEPVDGIIWGEAVDNKKLPYPFKGLIPSLQIVGKHPISQPDIIEYVRLGRDYWPR